ncbi:hypothetical protein H4R18_003809 [Coemansia javaensis]|uniref:Uncharacterized protein n=1 Tax=Coemansia javaensis TaxID=2761396 RepID=A0A9W8LI00_9FUNG|nr:hypothetical protein H4R18_003809 [Coemansia javaensis]
MLRGCLLGLVILLLLAQFLASVAETAVYAGEKVYLDNNNLLYTKGWFYNYKWVVKPLSAVVALGLVLPAICSCCCGGPDRRFGTGGRVFPSVLTFFSLALTALWAVVVGYQQRNGDSTLVNNLISQTISSGQFVYPLGTGFSLKNDCNAPPFTVMDHGTTVCALLKAETAVAIVCLGIWGLTLLLALFLFCFVRRRKVSPLADAKPTHY